MLEYLLFGAQAAGVVGDIWSQGASLSVARRGQQLEESQLDLRMKQERIASNEQSLFNLEQLQETLATQRAMMSVRGGLPGVGSSLAIEARSISNFNKDERARSLSLEFTEQQRRAQIAVGRIALAGQRAKAGSELFARGFNMIPFNQIYQKIESKNAKVAPPPTGKKPGLLTPGKAATL